MPSGAVHGGFIDGPGASGGFHEEDHPRDAGGKFEGKPGGVDEKGPAGDSSGSNGDSSGGGAKVEFGTSPAEEKRIAAELKTFFGRDVSPKEMAEIVGAPHGATVVVDVHTPEQFQIQTIHPHFIEPQVRVMYQTGSGMKVMCNQHNHLRDNAPKGLGTQILKGQVEKAREMGISALFIKRAARNDSTGYVGYHVWPRLGFDGKLPAAGTVDGPHTLPELPESLKSAETLQDLQATEEGKEWWKANGISVFCDFKLDPESRSSQVFAAYLAKKGL